MSESKAFEEWAMLELMGHQRMAGRISEAVIAGSGFLRIDIPEVEGREAFTRFVSPSSVYAINPVTESIARRLAASFRSAPISRYDLPDEPKPAAITANCDDDVEEEDDWDDDPRR